MSEQIVGEINELLEELKKEHGLGEMKPGDITGDDVAAATGHERKYCNQFLREKVQQGVYKSFKVRGPDGKIVTVYRKA